MLAYVSSRGAANCRRAIEKDHHAPCELSGLSQALESHESRGDQVFNAKYPPLHQATRNLFLLGPFIRQIMLFFERVKRKRDHDNADNDFFFSFDRQVKFHRVMLLPTGMICVNSRVLNILRSEICTSNSSLKDFAAV